MARIKVTGYIDPHELPFEEVDLDHPMGLSETGYQYYLRELLPMTDIDFVLEDDDED
jgi:hypothetical protein